MRPAGLLHDLRSRPLVNVLLFALSAAAVLTAVLGPLLLAAITQSSLSSALQGATSQQTSVTVVLDGVQGDQGTLPAEVAGVLTPTLQSPTGRFWTAPQAWSESAENLPWSSVPRGNALAAVSRVHVLDDRCSGLPIATGHCPTRPGQVLVSVRDARQRGLRVGSTVTYRLLPAPQRQSEVVGTYDSEDAGSPLTRPGGEAAGTAAVTSDPLALTGAEVATSPLTVRVSARTLLRPGLLVSDVPDLRASVAGLIGDMLRRPYPLVLDSGLLDLLDRVDARNADARVLVTVTEVQALALAGAAVAVVLQRLARARTAEWAVGRLRGVPRHRWLASIYAEPSVVLLAGVPVGVLAGLLTARLAVAATLPPGTPVELWRGPVLVTVAAVVLVVVVSLVAVSLPSLRRPLVELIAMRSERRRLTPAGAVVQAVAVLSAAATLYELRLGGVLSTRGPQLGLLAPALFTLALALLVVRAAVLAVRRVTARPPRRLVALVVARQVVRTPSALTPVIVLAVGVALAVFASQVLVLSGRNADLRAAAEVGADTVLHVDVRAGVDLVSAVRAADPGGRAAMAVQERVAGTDRGTSRIVAVDSTRLAAVVPEATSWTGVEDLATALHPTTDPPVVLTGSRVAVALSQVEVTPGAVSIGGTLPADPVLTLILDTGPRWRTVELGPIHSAAVLRARIPCRQGCRVAGFGLVSAPGAPYQATLTIDSVGTDRTSASASHAWLGGPGRWHSWAGGDISADPVAKATPAGYVGSLSIQASDSEGGYAVRVSPSDVVDPLPAVLAPAANPDPFPGVDGAAYGNGLDGQPQLIGVVGHASVLPRSTGDGVLVDLVAAQRLSDPAADEAVSEVWLAPGAPPGVEAALAVAGVQVRSRERLADARLTLRAQPTTRAAAVAVSLGASALLLALLAMVAARVVDLGRRRADWRSLRDAGLRAATVRRLAFVEIAAPALLGTALGLAGGLGALRLAAGRLPLVDLSTAGPPLELQIAWPPVALVALVVVVAVLAGAALGSRAESR